jgi:hypothetical protein
MKRIVNVSKRYLLMVVKSKDTVGIDTFKDCDTKLKDDLVRIVFDSDDIFQVLKGLPPNRQVEHDIQLQKDVPLPNVRMYRSLVLENVEINKQVQELVEQGVIRPSASPCGSPIILVPKKYGTWRMCMDFRALNKIMVKKSLPFASH